VKASDINAKCRIGRILYRDWYVLTAVWAQLYKDGMYWGSGTFEGGIFKCYSHDMLRHDVMVIIDANDEIEDVFQVDPALLGRIAASTMYPYQQNY